jgi:alpha/beta superfamily hydrolase
LKRHRLRIKLPVGKIETVIEDPEWGRRGLALIAHPHPLHGGSLDNKVASTLAKAAVNCDLVAVRPNFRGVGASEGSFDHGIGETEDLLALAAAVESHYPDLPWTLMGFSFGAYVQHRVAAQLAARRLIMVGPAVSMYAFAAPAIRAHIIHGDQDELIPLAAVRAYAHGHGIPLHVIEGAGHFFHGRLVQLRALAEELCAQS